MIAVRYFSGSGNTKVFVESLGVPNTRIDSETIADEVVEPFILVAPTYCSHGSVGAIPAPVKKFLNRGNNRYFIRGVVACGDRNFGSTFCQVGTEIRRRYNAPILHQMELRGFDHDVQIVKELIETWK